MSKAAGGPQEHLASRLLPVLDDPDTAGFWAAMSQRQLTVRRCAHCSAVIHLPRAYCARCGGWDTEWTPVRGDASVYSWTVAEHQVHPAYPTPYTIVLVALADEPLVRFLTYLPGVAQLKMGQSMRLTFETVTADDGEEPVVLPRWIPA
jgi:uncharacterized OB-fold protein